MLLARAEAARLDESADFFRQIAHIVHFFFEAGAQAHFFAQVTDIVAQASHGGQVFNAVHMSFHGGLDFGHAFSRFGVRGVEQGQLIVIAHDDAHMIGQIRRGLEHFDAAGGQLHVLVDFVVQLTHLAVLQQHFFGAEALVGVGQSVHFGGQAGHFAHVLAQVKVKDNKARGHLFAQHLGKAVFQLLELGPHHAFQLALVKGFQGLRVHANVAQHEFRAQQAHFKLREVTQAREEQSLPHIGQHQPHLGFGGG